MANWKVVVVAVIKDEELYIEDWLLYHIALGVDHFFIYDNGSSDGTTEVLRKSITAGRATLISWPVRAGQIDAYNHAAQLLRFNTDWLGFLDIDEYLVTHDHDDIYTYLTSLDTDEVLIPWRNFSYSGHTAKPGGPSLENFFWAHKVLPGSSTQVKHFVRPEKIKSVNAHFSYITSDNIKKADGEKCNYTHAVTNPVFRGAQINHYSTRSFVENTQRLSKGQVSGSSHKTLEAYVPINHNTSKHFDYDDSILRHLSRFKRISAQWSNLSSNPHRFGMNQGQPVLSSHNIVVFYTVKSFCNYLSSQEAVKPVSAIPVSRKEKDGSETNLNSMLYNYSKDFLHFQVLTPSSTPYFQGSIHYGDLVRRFGYNCQTAARKIKVEKEGFQAVIEHHRDAVLCIIDLESVEPLVFSMFKNKDEKIIIEAIPSGHHCAVVYVSNNDHVGPYTISVQGRGEIHEFLAGTLP